MLLQRLKGRADGGAADAKHVRELVLRRQPAVLEAALQNRMQDCLAGAVRER